MEPIIDPMFFYWAEVCEFVGIVTIILAIAATAGSIMTAMAGFMDNDKGARRAFWCLVPLALLFWVAATFTPSRKTLVLMQVAKNITPDNVQSLKQLTGDVRESVKADIIDIIEAVTKKEESK